ncbi:hypothetical protein ACWDA7_41715 [Streptomyces sp. NPDC001156]
MTSEERYLAQSRIGRDGIHAEAALTDTSVRAVRRAVRDVFRTARAGRPAAK